MKTVVVKLPDDLADFVERAVVDGTFDSPDDLFAHAVGLVRTETVLGHPPAPTGSRPVLPASAPQPLVATTTVDLTRQGFDGPAFMANLVGKIKENRSDAAKPPRS